jgi:hypothetical protein
MACRPKYHDAAMLPADRDQRRRRMRPQALHAEQHRECRHRHRECHHRRLGKMVQDAQHILKETLLGDVEAEQLGELVEHDHQADSGLEARSAREWR